MMDGPNVLRQWCLQNLARPQPGQAFIPQIDGLRFVAILAVLLYHVQGYVEAQTAGVAAGTADPLHSLFAIGYFGVPLFFAISGYIIARPFFGPIPVVLERYFLRRLTRLEPPYILNLLIIFVLKIAFLGAAFPELFPHLLASMVYAHGLIYGTHSEVNGVAWSLEVEWQFYLSAPLVFAGILRTRGRTRHLLLGFAVLLGGWLYLAFGDADTRLSLSLLRYPGFFVAGVWVALLDEEGALGGVSDRAFDTVGALSGLSLIAVLMAGKSASIALPALTFVLLLCALRGPALGRLLAWWPIHCIGAMCYSIYLYHFFVVSALGKAFGGLVSWPASPSIALLVFACLTVPLTLLACAVPYLLIERPFMVWRPGQNRLRDAFRFRAASALGASKEAVIEGSK